MAEINILGEINTDLLEAEFGKLLTNEIVITNERLNHIKTRHPEDFSLFCEYGVQVIQKPDIIIKDCNHKNTIFMVKKLKDTNLNVVARLSLEEENENLKNSVMTFYRLRQKNLLKMEKKHKILYKSE